MAVRRASFSGTARSEVSPTDIKDLAATITSPSAGAAAATEKEVPKILSVLSCTLEYLITRNEKDFPVFTTSLGSPQHGTKKLSLFYGLRPPSIGVNKYLERIFKYTNCSPSCFVVAYVYIDQLVHRHPDQPITSLNVHRLLITSVMIAAKVLDDVHYNNAYYARVGGISIAELNRLELDLLFQLDFRLQVTIHTFESYCTHLEREFVCVGHRSVVDRALPAFYQAQDFGNTRKAAMEER